MIPPGSSRRKCFCGHSSFQLKLWEGPPSQRKREYRRLDAVTTQRGNRAVSSPNSVWRGYRNFKQTTDISVGTTGERIGWSGSHPRIIKSSPRERGPRGPRVGVWSRDGPCQVREQSGSARILMRPFQTHGPVMCFDGSDGSRIDASNVVGSIVQ